MEILAPISDLIISGFVLTTILLLLAYWFLPTQRQIVRELIVLSNVYLIIGSLIFLTLSVRQILSYSDGNDEWERYALTNRLFGPYWFAYLGTTLFKGIMPQILWISKVRKNIWTSIALVPFLLVEFYMPLLYSHNRGYLPSSWTMYFGFSELFLNIVIFGFVLTITFLILRKENVA